MSHIPNLSSELSPWPRIRIGEVPSNATAVDRQTTFPRLPRGSSQRSVRLQNYTKPRGRASTDAGRIPTKSQVRGRSRSFGATQQLENVCGSVPVQRLDRKASDCQVQELLKLRNQKLKEAKRKGDEIEASRLKNLSLFDDIERPKSSEDEPKEVACSGDFTGQINHHGLTSQIDVADYDFPPRPKSVNQGHTATLCWHLKLEHTKGLRVPDEFSQCKIHPTPSPYPSSTPINTLEPTSPSSPNSRSRHTLRHTKIGSSTPRESAEPCSPATQSSTAVASEPSSPTKQPPIASISNEEDPFLYITKYIRRHAKRDTYIKKANPSAAQASTTHSNRPSPIKRTCTCTTHSCRIYLSGPPSKHCPSCKQPAPHPDIVAAVHRIEQMKTSVLSQAHANVPATEDTSAADEFHRCEDLQEDIRLVEMYNRETEKRCRKGVWWEGWRVVEELRGRGVVGSRRCGVGRRGAVV